MRRTDEGAITLKTPWHVVAKAVCADDRYIALVNGSGLTPKDLFHEFLEDVGTVARLCQKLHEKPALETGLSMQEMRVAFKVTWGSACCFTIL